MAALIVLALAGGCAAEPGATVTVRFHHPVEQDVAAAGTTVAAIVEAHGRVVGRSEEPIDTRELVVPVEPGDGLAVEIDVLDASGFVTARGRSFPFVFDGGDDEVVDVWIARTGLFGEPDVAAPGEPIAAAWPLEPPLGTGALVVTEEATLLDYTHHDPGADGAPSVTVRHHLTRPGALWARLGTAHLLAVGGARGGASVFEVSSGVEIASLSAADLAAHRTGAALAEVDATVAILVGGATDAGALPGDAVTALRFDGSALRAVALAPLPVPRRDASVGVVQVPAASGTTAARVVVVGGAGAAGLLRDAALLDPGGVDPVVTVPDALSAGRTGAAVVPIAVGAILVAGGTAEGTALDDVLVLAARRDALEVVRPAIDDRLFDPRSRAAAVSLAPGRVLLAGGLGRGNVPLASAELIDWGTPEDPFGFVRPTGTLPWPAGAPHAVLLGDRTVLTIDASGAALYVPF